MALEAQAGEQGAGPPQRGRASSQTPTPGAEGAQALGDEHSASRDVRAVSSTRPLSSTASLAAPLSPTSTADDSPVDHLFSPSVTSTRSSLVVASPPPLTPSASRSTSPTPAAHASYKSRSLSTAALAALADSPARPRPPLPPKSAARISRASTYSSSGARSRSSSVAGPPADGSTAGSTGHERPPSSVLDEGAVPAVTTTPAAADPLLSGSTLDQPRPRLAPLSRTPSRSQASSRTSSGIYTPSTGALRGSSGFLSSSEEGGAGAATDADGSGWLGTPATTTGYSSAAEGSPSLVPGVGMGAIQGKRHHIVAPPQLEPPSMRSGGIGLGFPPPQQQQHLEGLGIDFITPSSSSAGHSPQTGTRLSFDGEGEFARDLARLSAFAQSLPSPLPGVAAPHSAVGEWGERRRVEDERGTLRPHAQAQALLDDHTLVLPQAAADLAPPPPPLPVFAPALGPGPRARETSATSTWTTSSVSSSRRPSLLNIPSSFGSGAQLSVDRLASPATDTEAYPSMGEETDFLSTDADGEDDDEDDSFGFLRRARAGGSSARYQAFGAPLLGPESSFATGSSAPSGGAGGTGRVNSLWNEDAPAWAFGALGAQGGGAEGMQLTVGAPEEDVVDWSGRAIEKKELPAETTHLILSRSRTPFQIAPLLTLTVPTLTHGLVVLDISECGLSEVPSAIASCCFLEELSLSGNPLATGTLPSFLGTLPALHVLLADSCNLSTLPSSLAQLSRLHTLTLRNNRLRTLPAWLARLGALETLLVDDNPFHWQVQSVVRPLFITPGDGADAATPLSRVGSPLPLPIAPEGATSVPLASPSPFFRSAAGTPIFNAFSTPPLGAPPLVPSPPELAAALESVRADLHAWEASPVPTPAPFAAAEASPGPSLPASPPPEPEQGDKKDKQRKWGRLLKKVSGTRLRSGSKPPLPAVPLRPGALDPDLRTYSQPVTRGEESEAELKSSGGGRMFGSVGRKMKKRSKDPSFAAAGLALHGARTAPPQKRRSFLLLDAFASSPQSATAPSLPAAPPQDHSAALRSVLAYLRDLDDLSPDVSLPAIPLDASTPPLRHSPSLGALGSRPGSPASTSAAAVRRAQSTRRLPSTGSGSSSSAFRSSFRISQSYDEAPDAGARAPPFEGKKSADDPAKREAVLKEIVETEQTYLRGLEELCGIYVASASVPVSSSANGGRRDTVLPSAERRAVFGNIVRTSCSTVSDDRLLTSWTCAQEAIRDFHRKVLLPDLLAAVREGGDSVTVAGKVGDVFVQHASFMKIYSSYINSFDDALARIQTWAKTTSRSRSNTASGGAPGASPALGSSSTMFDATAGFASTLSSSQKKRIKSWLKISLESYLLLPIQRIPRYRLLLETLLSTVPPPRIAPEPSTLAALLDPHAQIAQAVTEMDDVAVTLNESKRENEGRAQLVMWQNRLATRFKSPLVQPHRTLLRSGNLTLVRSVKRSTAPADPPLPSLYRSANGASPAEPEEVPTLFQETKQIHLIGLLCTDLLVLVKAPPPPLDQDPNAPVELYTVLRLNSAQLVLGSPAGRGDPPASLFGSEDMLRLRVGDKAICYLRIPGADATKARKEALQWVNAINLQYEVNT
ncbi:hypothetical protein JCM10449v2_003407 [Rhodotorula kratochvilovae]